MGWYDYFVNQSDKDIVYTLDVHDSFVTIKYNVIANHNQLFSRYASGSSGWCLYGLDSFPINDSNRCQNFEFRIGPDGSIVEYDGYAGRPPGPMQSKYPPVDVEYFSASPAVSLDYAKQRVLARSLAAAEGAERTKALIESSNSFKDIFEAAAAERGVENLVAGILKGPSEWAYQALLSFPVEGEQRDALIAKALDDPKWAFYTVRDIKDLEDGIRGRLLQRVADDQKWAKYAVADIPDLGDQSQAMAKAAGQS